MGTRIVFLGDDFTGASDSLATYARTGLRARLVLNDRGDMPGELDVLGLPTDLRSLTPDPARVEAARIWPRIAAESPEVLHYKVCSTFDSAPEIGSIGAVAAELIDRFAPDVVAVIGGQPSLGRYCAFGTLFARGPDGAIHRIDRHPVMRRHPVTPMAEADLRRHLAAQNLADLHLVMLPDLSDMAGAIDKLRQGPVLFDAMTAEDLVRIGEILRAAGGRQLLIGASSVAEIVAGSGQAQTAPSQAPPPDSPNVLVFAGSRSANTAAQVAAASGYHTLRLAPDALRSGETAAAAAAILREGVPLLAHLDPDFDYGLDSDTLADASSAFVETVSDQVDIGHLGLAGGDTASRICARLGFDALDLQESLGAGSCICVATHRDHRRDRIRVMLKGGQMGKLDLFDQFLSIAKRDCRIS